MIYYRIESSREIFVVGRAGEATVIYYRIESAEINEYHYDNRDNRVIYYRIERIAVVKLTDLINIDVGDLL